MPQVAKLNETISCPECAAKIHVGIEYQIPRVIENFTVAQSEAARTAILESLAHLELDTRTRDYFRSFVSNRENAIGPGDVKVICDNAIATADAYRLEQRSKLTNIDREETYGTGV